MHLYSLDNVQSLLLSNISDKKIAEEANIDISLVQQLRQDSKNKEKFSWPCQNGIPRR